jgi:hypothetical protein
MNFDSRPPIPEARGSGTSTSRGERPPELDMAAALLALFALLSMMLFDPTGLAGELPKAAKESGQKVPNAATVDQMISGLRALMWMFTTLWLFFIYKFWRGRNWARVLVMIGSALTLVNLLFVASLPNPIAQVATLLDVVFSAYMLHWLSRPEIAAYFQSPREKA